MDWRFGLALVLSAFVWIVWFNVVVPAVWPPPPAIRSFEPASGPAAGGATFTLTGARFDARAAVTFGDVAAAGCTITPTTITGPIPAGAPGTTVAVKVTNPDGQWAVAEFEYLATDAAGGPPAIGPGPAAEPKPDTPTPPEVPPAPAFPRTDGAPRVTVTLGDPEAGNGTIVVTCTSLGAAIETWTLSGWRNRERTGPYVPLRAFQGLVEGVEGKPPLTQPRPPLLVRLRGSDAATELAQVDWVAVDADGRDGSAAFAYETGTGLRFTKRFTLAAVNGAPEPTEPAARAARFTVRVECTVENLDAAKPRLVAFELEGPAGIVPEGGIYVAPQTALLGVQAPGERERVKSYLPAGVKGGEAPHTLAGGERLNWCAVTNAYFAAALRPADDTRPAAVVAGAVWPADAVRAERDRAPPGPGRTTADLLQAAATQLAVGVRHEVTLPPAGAAAAARVAYDCFVGPKEPALLQAVGLDGAREAGVFDAISRLLLWILIGLHFVTRSWGLAVILLTMLVRLAMHKLSFWMQRSMTVFAQKMKDLQPKLERIKKQFPDPARQRQEQARLMQESGMRPPLGCLGIFLQFPIFIAIYQVFLRSVELRQAGFLWIDDLAQPDHLVALGFAIPIPCPCMPTPTSFDHINLLPLLWIGLMQVSQSMSVQRMEEMTEQQRQQMKMMRWMMPLFGLMFWNVPAAAALYVLTSTAWGMVENKYIRRKLVAMGLVTEPKPKAPPPPTAA